MKKMSQYFFHLDPGINFGSRFFFQTEPQFLREGHSGILLRFCLARTIRTSFQRVFQTISHVFIQAKVLNPIWQKNQYQKSNSS